MGGSVDTPAVRGHVAEGFEPVRSAFRTNLRDRDELGAACAVSYRGELVVDIWGGYRDLDRTEEWDDDTMVLLFSATKGICAIAMALAHSRGYFDYEDRIATHWPAFGQHGKEDVSVRTLLDQQAGLAGLETTLTPETVRDRTALVRTLARKQPDWVPGSRHGYHAWSLGWYESEVLRRTDPAGRTLGAFIHDEIAAPLDLEFSIGLPDDVSPERIAEVRGFRPLQMLANVREYPPRMLVAMANPWSVTSRALLPLRFPDSLWHRHFHPFAVRSPARLAERRYRDLEIPAANGFGYVRALADLYGRLAYRPETVGIDEATMDLLGSQPDPPTAGRRDVVLKMPTLYSLGFWKPYSGFRFGSDAAFGAPGVGGSFAFADPARDLGFAYAPNRMGADMIDDPRERALRRAVDECLPTARPTS